MILHFGSFAFFFFFSNWKLSRERGHERRVLERHVPLISFPRPLTDGSPSRSNREGSSSESALKVLFFGGEAFILFICRQNSRMMALLLSCGVNQYSTCADLRVRICRIHKRNPEWKSVVKKSAFIKSSWC